MHAWKVKHDNALEELPGWKTEINTWRNKHSDVLDRLPAFETDTNNSLSSLTATASHHSSQLRGFAGFANTMTPRLSSLESWKGNTNSHLNTLFKDKLSISTYKTATDELEEWKKGAETKLANLNKNAVNVQIYNDNNNRLTNELTAISGKTDWLKDSYNAAIPPIQNHLTDLEGRTKDLETRVTGHDGKIKGFEGEFTKLGTRIEDQGKQMVDGFCRIETKLKELTDRPKLPKPKRDLSLTKYQSNHNSPGGINVANCGQLSVQHAPNCVHLSDNFNPSNCPCQTQIRTIYPPCKPSQPWIPNGIGLLPYHEEGYDTYFWGRRGLLPILGGGDAGFGGPRGYFGYGSGKEKRTRQSSLSDLGEESRVQNHTPSFTLNLGRTSGGGLFSKPRKEEMQIELGSGGGYAGSGRRRFRDRESDVWKRS